MLLTIRAVVPYLRRRRERGGAAHDGHDDTVVRSALGQRSTVEVNICIVSRSEDSFAPCLSNDTVEKQGEKLVLKFDIYCDGSTETPWREVISQ